jgi:hypothetical protein
VGDAASAMGTCPALDRIGLDTPYGVFRVQSRPMSTLRSKLDELAGSFANSVLAAIRGASLEDLLAEGGRGTQPRRGPGRPRGSSTTKSTPTAARASAPARKPAGRLRRRTSAEIAKSLAQVVALVKTKKAGLRSEEIRATLKLDKREVPRILYEGLKSKKLRSKGQKRATTYFSA